MSGREWFLKLCEAACGHARVGTLAAARYAIEQAEYVLHNNDECDAELDRHYLNYAKMVFIKAGESRVMWHGGIDTVSPRAIVLRMLDRGWLPYEIDVKLDDIAERAKTMIVSIKMRRAAKWCRENL